MKSTGIIDDASFDALYPEGIKAHSFIHWTPVEIIETALQWLDPKKSTKILDIGSGAGKFCILGSMFSKASFTGVEFREDLVKVARATAKVAGATNVTFINDNIANIDFRDYDAFYYYNPFCEFLAEFDRIDDRITYDPGSFRRYEDYVIEQLEQVPVGTRIVTYCSGTFPLPATFDLKNLLYDGKLALWQKMRAS